MGQRANLLIIEAGRRTLYYDHWCANRLDDELFWGPEEALHFIRQRGPIGQDGWLDETWCEGAAVVDVQNRVLLFFGGEDLLFDARARRVFFDLFRRQWEGWDVRWVPEGIMSIADYVGLPREQFASQQEYEPDTFLATEDNTLITEARAGEVRLAVIHGGSECLLSGPDALDRVLRGRFLGLVGGARWRRQLVWRNDEFPRGGLHLDRAQRTIMTWWADDTSDTRREMGELWRGWTIDWRYDDYDPHLALCGPALILPPFDVAATQRTLLDHLERGLVDAPPSNPAREIDLGDGGQVSEWTEHSRGREHSERKRARLAGLRRELGM